MITDESSRGSSPDVPAAPESWTACGWYDRDGRRHWFPEPVIIQVRAARPEGS
jgi:hypothetical protein